MGIPTKVPIDLVNPTPAASTDLSDYVTLNTNQSITGVKTFTNRLKIVTSSNTAGSEVAISNPSITKGTAPSTTLYANIGFYGSEMSTYEDRIGLFECQYNTDNSTHTRMMAINSTSAKNTNSCSRSCNGDSSGNVYTYAPTPATSDNSTQIATTAYVKSNLNGYLPLSGGTITGTIESTNPHFGKMSTDTSELVLFGGNAVDTSNPVISLRGKSKSTQPGTVYIRACTTTSNPKILLLSPNGEMRWGKDPSDYFVTGHYRCQVQSLTKGTAPSSTNYGGLYTLCDKNGVVYAANALGLVETSVTTSNLVSTYIRALKNEANSTVNCQISCNVDASGNAYTAAPTPATTDSSTKIATTAFVKSALSTWNAVTVTAVTAYCA